MQSGRAVHVLRQIEFQFERRVPVARARLGLAMGTFSLSPFGLLQPRFLATPVLFLGNGGIEADCFCGSQQIRKVKHGRLSGIIILCPTILPAVSPMCNVGKGPLQS